MNEPRSLQVDHINGDTLDNRKTNLRVCTRAQNCINKRKRSLTSSRYKGVSWHKRGKRWGVSCQVDKKPKWIGSFACEKEAALAYNAAAISLHGEFATLNVVED
jgi:hypothetical protein